MSPARIYAIRTFFSFVPLVLYVAGALILGTNRLIRGPKAEDSYRDMYLVSLAVTILCALVSGHQVFTTALASWVMRGFKDHRDDLAMRL